MHGWWKPFGLFGKHAFYRPLRKLLGEKAGHRRILHSLIGCLFTSLFFALISLVLYLVGVFFMWYVWIGIPIGFLLHLAEDSFTYSGVKWFYPRTKVISSTTVNTTGSEWFLVGIWFVVFGTMTVIVYFLVPLSLITLLLTVGVTTVLLVILHRINPRISEIGNRRYSLEELVEFYIEDVGGKRIKDREPYGPVLQIGSDEEHILPIIGVGGRYPLHYDWENEYSYVEASSLEEDDVIEMRTYKGKKERRVYYVVMDGTFYAFLKRFF